MELFRVGGDVPDTNYLFMGTWQIMVMLPESPASIWRKMMKSGLG